MMKKLLLLFVCMLSMVATYAQYSPNPDPGNMRTFGYTSGDSLHAPYRFKAVTRMAVDSTYFSIHYFTGRTIPLEIVSDQPFYAYLFYASDPDVLSLSYKSILQEIHYNQHYYKLEEHIAITQAGYYALLVTSMNKDVVGMCTVDVGNGPSVSLLGHNHITYSQPANEELNTFAIGGAHSDVQIFVVQGSNPGTIVAYNDNYVGTGNHNWGTNARIKKTYTTSPSGVIVNCVKKGTPCNRKVDVYIGCDTISQDSINKYYFSNYKSDDAIVAASRTPDGSALCYNCYAWAGKEWTCWVCPDDTLSEFYSSESPLRCFDNYFGSRGLTRIGANAANSVVDLWGRAISNTDTILAHASVKAFCGDTEGYHSLGYAWESKVGHLERVFHPRAALASPGYGEILYHYIVAPANSRDSDLRPDSDMVYEHIMFNDSERMYLATQAASIAPDVRSGFDTRFEEVETMFNASPISSLRLLEQEATYQSLLSYCMMYPVTESLVFQKLDAGSIIAVKLVGNLYAHNHVSAYDQMRNYIAANKTNDRGQTIRHPLLSNATLFAKCMMNDNAIQNLPMGNQRTYSNDENVLNVKVNGSHIAFEVLLDHDATVSVDIASVFGNKIMTVMAQDRKDSGKHHADLFVAKEGTYVVCCSIDGRTYTKKITIQ